MNGTQAPVLALQRLAALVLQRVDQVVGQVVHRLDLAGLERVDLGAGVGEVLDLELVDEALAPQ